MEKSPSLEANSHSVSQEVPHLSWNPKFYYRVHNDPLFTFYRNIFSAKFHTLRNYIWSLYIK